LPTELITFARGDEAGARRYTWRVVDARTKKVERPALRGTLLALASALAFGLTTPLVQRFGHGVGAFATASLLYTGAAVVGLGSRSKNEAMLRREHLPRVVAIALLGAGLAPAALAWGLARTSGTSASLMLNLEAVFTLLLARAFYGEHVGRRVGIAAALLVVGGGLLVLDRGGPAYGSPSHVLGLVAVAAAALGWAADNALAKPLAQLDPAAVVASKAALGAMLSACAALALGEAWPSTLPLVALMIVGATGYGISLRLYLRAQRALGAGRTASVFASAPFCGALLAFALGEPVGGYAIAAGAVMALGLLLHVTERHVHVHAHEEIEHAHAHAHDDGHHDHVHDAMPEGEHTHAHRHAEMEHEHAHVPDFHHEHAHAAAEVGHSHEHAPVAAEVGHGHAAADTRADERGRGVVGGRDRDAGDG
jgi:drug/metabolite transporter (DMT)-like permease